MRKKILRSKSGFEKPESREEAIMQNILGASNVLEPAESNIEEILQAILYNTPYTKEPETNIEEILLAIKNNGTYTGECESRDMKILFAILNGLNYTEEAESRIEKLFIEWLYQRSSIKVLEGVPPLTFTSRGLPLINYFIEGNTIQNGLPQGVGERTGNLFDISLLEQGGWLAAAGTVPTKVTPEMGTYTTRIRYKHIISLLASTLSLYCPANIKINFVWIDVNGNSLGGSGWKKNGGTATAPEQAVSMTFILGLDSDIECTPSDFYDINLVSGAIAPESYEPYGYKIPITCGGTTTNIYIGESPLYDGDAISMADTGIEIPTAFGNNVLTVDTTVQPANVYIEYK